MDVTLPEPPDEGGRLAENIVQFCRALRAAGLPIGPGQMLRAVEAVSTVGIGDREDLYWTLHAALITRQDQRELFDQTFHFFWRNPDLLKRLMGMLMPTVTVDQEKEQKKISRRVSEAMQANKPGGGSKKPNEPPELDIDATLTVSEREVLRTQDFEDMSAAEIEKAKKAIARLTLPVPERKTRRFRQDAHGPQIDMRKTLRQSLRGGAGGIDLARRQRRTRQPPLVILCDISGSMSRYSRMLLHFLYAITDARARVHSFVFGTRLTNITRLLRRRDVDEALERIGQSVEDWSGGTRIGQCLRTFNHTWSRRVLGEGAVVMLITDGLDRDAGIDLEPEIERLHKSARRLIWLNPLLRYDGYAPKSKGAQVLIRHVDDFRTVHNLESLENLVDALTVGSSRRRMGTWRARAIQEPAA
ncbi:MAG: VWA domain-containing protein [Pseudomonadota bacterium]